MRKIVISIQNNALIFSYKTSQVIREDLMNTNIISDSELVFSDDYILQNQKLVIPFLEELCEMNSIDTILKLKLELLKLKNKKMLVMSYVKSY